MRLFLYLYGSVGVLALIFATLPGPWGLFIGVGCSLPLGVRAASLLYAEDLFN